ncbi:MAG TPA: GntR family transcriptional regulator [Clostridiaceae bacterium]|nr:GntR family transcriptional regulator [Clostridiaceae bacterium]
MKNIQKKLKEMAYKYIKEKIIFCELVPGSVIQENEIANELSISRTPVREALLELEKEGYVNIVPRQATTVPKVSLKDINEIIQIRNIIEVQCLKLIETPLAEEIKEKLREFKTIFQNYININKENNYKEFLQNDLEFHVYLVSLLGNSQLTNFCRELLYKSLRFWYLMIVGVERRISESSTEHVKIIDFLLENNIDKAAKALEEHILVSKESMLIINE